MTIKLGTLGVSDLRIGVSPVQALYLGGTLVWVRAAGS